MHGAGIMATTSAALLRLMQLSSPALPVGGYAFSQGMETAVDEGWLVDRETTTAWCRQQLTLSLARIDIPLLIRQHQAILAQDLERFDDNNTWVLACRETAELRLSDTAMGEALARLMKDLDEPIPGLSRDISFVSAFACAAARWDIDEEGCCQGFLWSWLENQAAAATKLVPLGQTDAQRLLGELHLDVNAAIVIGRAIDDPNVGGSLPALALASCRHESQYSRLFRS